MATKLKNDAWSVAAIVIALFSLLYCFAFIIDFFMPASISDLMSSLRTMPKGDS